MSTSTTHTAIPRPARRRPYAGEQRIVLRGVDWETYQRIAGLTARRDYLVAFDRGALELMSPGFRHEDDKTLIGRLIELATEELEIPCRGLGSARWERPESERAIEADECYYFGPDKIAAAPEGSDDPADYPPPDLAVEVDLSGTKIDRPAIYATLGVPEVWRFDGETLRIDHLRPDGTYEVRDETRFLPIRPGEVVRWVRAESAADQSAWARRLRRWVREEVATRGRDRA